jgi:hypothetical protein
MQSEEDIREALNHAETMQNRFDDAEAYMEGIGVGVISETLKWVLEQDDFDTLLEDLREDVNDTSDDYEE